MSNTESAKKMARKIEARTKINRMNRSIVRTYVKRVQKAIDANDKPKAQEEFRTAQPHLHRAAAKGVFHKNNIARRLSALSARIKAMEGEFSIGAVKETAETGQKAKA